MEKFLSLICPAARHLFLKALANYYLLACHRYDIYLDGLCLPSLHLREFNSQSRKASIFGNGNTRPMHQSRIIKLVFAALLSPLLPTSGAAYANDLTIAPSTAASESNETFKDALPGENLLFTEQEYPYQPGEFQIQNFDVWDRIRKGFAIPDLNNPLVATHTTWYSARPEYIQRISQRASRYLFHVVQELEKRQMPTELALLPFIESAFNPQAYSTAKAAGMWQFIPSTGRDFNLKQNAFRDERRDVVASTNAALNYLQKLYGMFGDWQLALAAYNWGEGSVSRAIAKAQAAGRPIDFNSLSAYMPSETRNYYPKLQAVKNIIATPSQYGVKLPAVENQPYFVSVKKIRDIDIKLAAQLAELPMEEFRALNPQFNRPIIPGSPTTNILLPQLNADKFKENLANWTQALSSWTAHRVTATRERIETIAAKFKTTPEIIREANSIPPHMHLKAGSTVLVPKLASSGDKDIADEVVDNSVMTIEADAPEKKRISIKAGKRDTLATIARRYKVTPAQIREWNALKSDKLTAGQALKVEVRAGKPKVARRNSKAEPKEKKPRRAH
jgi:membrane-bound lytic murein transglycosylase D